MRMLHMDVSHPKSYIQNTYVPAFSIFNVSKIAILNIYYSLINGKCPSVSFLQRNFCDHTEIRAKYTTANSKCYPTNITFENQVVFTHGSSILVHSNTICWSWSCYSVSSTLVIKYLCDFVFNTVILPCFPLHLLRRKIFHSVIRHPLI